jgi:hypothetical protein
LLFIRATAAQSAQSARSEDHDEEDTYLLARGSDDRRRLGRDDDGCIRAVAGTGRRLARRMEGWRLGIRAAAGIVGGLVIAGAIIASRPQGYVVHPGYAQPVYGPGCLLDIPAGLRPSRPRCRLHGAGRCRSAPATCRRRHRHRAMPYCHGRRRPLLLSFRRNEAQVPTSWTRIINSAPIGPEKKRPRLPTPPHGPIVGSPPPK